MANAPPRSRARSWRCRPATSFDWRIAYSVGGVMGLGLLALRMPLEPIGLEFVGQYRTSTGRRLRCGQSPAGGTPATRRRF